MENIFLSILSVLMGGIIGMVMDLKYKVEGVQLYWLLGLVTGIIAMTLFYQFNLLK